tara:strand:+ start:262 stop:1971 length:1710 start_codon:yes stop_codon:yes gene_type:complete
MTVLPNAPIDPATGLQVPTIAVATDGGVSVITDSGAVYDITYTSLNLMSHVTFRDDGSLVYISDSGSLGRYVHVDHNLPTADNAKGVAGNNGSADSEFYYSNTSNYTGRSLFLPNGTLGLIANNDFANNKGLTRIAPNRVTPTEGMNAWVTSSYNTGWMQGDIKGAWLSDTDTTSVTDTNLIVNGDFSNGTTGWTAAGCSISVVNGAMRITDTDGSIAYVTQRPTLEIGKTYVIQADIVTDNMTGNMILNVGTSDGSGQTGNQTLTATGSYSFTFTATIAQPYVNFRNTAAVAGDYWDVDNVTLSLAVKDRSVNANGLQVFGTITKTAVETGADLVGYSGFSASNYLQQPYNAGLDFGTGDFSVMGWVNVASANNEQFIKRIDPTNSGNGFMIVTDSGGEVSFYRIISGSSARLWEGSDISGDGWLFIAASRSSGLFSFYENGSLVNTSADTTDYTNTSANLYIGTNESQSASCSGSMALLRISATAPTAAQIAKIYEDEKFLFQENAGATLYGTSDAVTALAHDDATDLLHVGTSQGRSVFQGLRRVDNTTDAITAAISASNNLVAEE